MDKAPYDPRAIANLILKVRGLTGLRTTHLELQKLLYFCHGYYLSRFNEPLIEGHFEAWKDGPVHPYIYNCFRHYKANPIESFAMVHDYRTGEIRAVEQIGNKHVRRIVGSIVVQLRHLTASELRQKSHVANGPWHSVWESAKINLASSIRIPDDAIIRRYFRHLVSEPVDGDDLDAYEDQPPESIRGR